MISIFSVHPDTAIWGVPNPTNDPSVCWSRGLPPRDRLKTFLR